ncbi:MAG: CAP domain-containing protein [Flavobacteriaceae bacterium]|nr:CAP domain-containing protein [Flavobacteriaceae bacterium]
MKRSYLFFLVLFTSVFAVSCSKDSQKEDLVYNFEETTLAENNWSFAEDLLFWINDYRISTGLSELTMDRDLASSNALEHCRYMISNNRISHDHFSWRAQQLKSKGAESVGENVASGFDDPQILVRAWVQSPKHKQVLEGNYTKAGIGIMEDSGGKQFVTLLCYR